MSDLPEDILETARTVYVAIPDVFTEQDKITGIEIIAKALLTERDRCAKIADEQEAYHLSYGGGTEGMRAGTANMIACKIRDPD